MFQFKRLFHKSPALAQKQLKMGLTQLAFRNRVYKPEYVKRFQVIKNFPYIFENQGAFLHGFSFFQDHGEAIEMLRSMSKDPQYNLRGGFSFAYIALLNMIKDHDIHGLGRILEPTIRKDIYEELHELVFNNIALKLENEDKLSQNPIQVGISDYAFNIGADINRESNRNMRIQKLETGTFLSETPNDRIKIYAQEDMEISEDTNITLELLVQFCTSFKFNPYLEDEPEVCYTNKYDLWEREIHYLRFETYLTKKKIPFWDCMEIAYLNKLECLKNASWIITDIDNRLNGNPHVD